MPFRFTDELSTADIAFEAWGETREELFASCSAALLRTMTEAPERVIRREHLTIRLEHEELDLLLWSFLQELIFFKDARRVLLHVDGMRIEERDGLFHLEANLSGEKIDAGRHRLLVDVKAVTLHRFRITCRDGRWQAFVVLDV